MASPAPSVSSGEDVGAPVWFPIAIGPEELDRYRQALGLPSSGEAWEALARGISASPFWSSKSQPGSDDRQALGSATLVLRQGQRPGLALVGRFAPSDQASIRQQIHQLPAVLRRIRYLNPYQAHDLCQDLGARLVDHLGWERLAEARFAAIPRGGLVVLGLVSIALGLSPGQILGAAEAHSPGVANRPLVVLDDVAISGFRFAEWLSRSPAERVIFAHLFSHPELRAAIEGREARVSACVSAADLVARPQSGKGPRPWLERAVAERYWIGTPELVCLPWNEPDRQIWNPERERLEAGWRVLPPELCLKNRPAGEATALPVQIQVPVSAGLGPPDSVFFAELDGAVAVGDLDRGRSFLLSGVAADMWRSLMLHGEMAAVEEELAQQYEVAPAILRRDLQAFVTDLTGRGLLRQGLTEP